MQGGDLGTVNWARGTKATWKVERAVNPSLSTFSKQDSDHLLKNLLCPSVPHKETGNFRGKKNGGLVSYMVAQGGWGCRGCWQEVSLAPELRRDHSPVFVLRGGHLGAGEGASSLENNLRRRWGCNQ